MLPRKPKGERSSGRRHTFAPESCLARKRSVSSTNARSPRCRSFRAQSRQNIGHRHLSGPRDVLDPCNVSEVLHCSMRAARRLRLTRGRIDPGCGSPGQAPCRLCPCRCAPPSLRQAIVSQGLCCGSFNPPENIVEKWSCAFCATIFGLKLSLMELSLCHYAARQIMDFPRFAAWRFAFVEGCRLRTTSGWAYS